jgi:hypothetical protein
VLPPLVVFKEAMGNDGPLGPYIMPACAIVMADKLKSSAASEMEIVLITLSSFVVTGWTPAFPPLLRAVPNILKTVVSSS